MNHIRTSPILPSALFFLVTALLLPGLSPAAFAKGGYFADQYVSVAGFQKDHFGKSEGDDQKFIPPADQSTTRPPALFSALSPLPAPASEVPFTGSQARAPPLS